MTSQIRAILLVSACVGLFAAGARAQLPAFPGAEGEGRHTTGGRGGDVYHVSNLNDSGNGSLRHGFDSARGPRTIVFEVGGAIPLQSRLRLKRSDITIAGETAPGQGIALFNYGLSVEASNVIMRHIRVRPGDAKKGPKTSGGFYGDAISIGRSDVIADHVSASWGIDENLSVAGSGTKRVTVQYSTISEGLDQTGLYHDEWVADYNPGGSGHHSHGSLIKLKSGHGEVTFHHNLWSNNNNRNPAVGSYSTDQTLKVDVRNNVLYNNRVNGYSSGDSGRLDMNYVGNYIVRGRFSQPNWRFQANDDNNMYIYSADNMYDGNKNGLLDGAVSVAFEGTYTPLGGPAAMAPITTDDAVEAHATIVASAGAFFWNRDAVDERLFNEVMTGWGRIINSQSEVGGYPVLEQGIRPTEWDLDGDGMPNWWEEMVNGLDPARADNNGDLDNNGYTNLEEYLHHQALGTRVPEPSSLALLAMASVGMLTRSVRRRT